jgi:hypothetical protein
MRHPRTPSFLRDPRDRLLENGDAKGWTLETTVTRLLPWKAQTSPISSPTVPASMVEDEDSLKHFFASHPAPWRDADFAAVTEREFEILAHAVVPI